MRDTIIATAVAAIIGIAIAVAVDIRSGRDYLRGYKDGCDFAFSIQRRVTDDTLDLAFLLGILTPEQREAIGERFPDYMKNKTEVKK